MKILKDNLSFHYSHISKYCFSTFRKIKHSFIYLRLMKKLYCNIVVVLINTNELILLDLLVLRIFFPAMKLWCRNRSFISFRNSHTVIIRKTSCYADALILREIIHGINVCGQICIWLSGYISSCLCFLLFSAWYSRQNLVKI